MGATTGIAWTRSTRNAWSGCTKVGPGCDGCYAEAASRRMRGVDPITLQATNWGPGSPRIPHLEGFDKDVRKWNALCGYERRGGAWHVMTAKQREPEQLAQLVAQGRKIRDGKIFIKCFTEGWPHPGFWPLFVNSYSDVLDNAVQNIWRGLVFTTLEECPNLNPQLVTKRIGNAREMFPARWLREWPKHVWMLITVVNQEELDRDGPKLLDLADMAGIEVVGLSIEPQIGEIDVVPFLERAAKTEQKVWGICGGESSQPGHPARPFVYGWGKRLARDFRAYGQPFFFKQLGTLHMNREGLVHPGISGKGDNPEQWMTELRVREFPEIWRDQCVVTRS